MIISHKHKFIFVHIPKTAGTSIKFAMKKGNIANDIVPNDEIDSDDYHHVTWRKIKRRFPEEWANYYKFAFVRNPYDHLVSAYEYNYKRNIIKFTEKYKTFEDFIINNSLDWWRQRRWICDDRSKIVVDFVGRFENLDEDFNAIVKTIGIDLKLDKHNSTDHKHWSEYYDDDLKRVAYSKLDMDFEIFGYPA